MGVGMASSPGVLGTEHLEGHVGVCKILSINRWVVVFSCVACADVERVRAQLVRRSRGSWHCEDGRKIKSFPQRHQLHSSDLVDELDSQLVAMAAAA